MKKELKQAIIAHIFEHENEFQLHNNTVEKFRAYIYDSEGSYLIGGEHIKAFIEQSIDLITNF